MVLFNALTSVGILIKPTGLILRGVKFSRDCLDCVLLTPRILQYYRKDQGLRDTED
jgi:hypothetical protein